MKNVTMYRTHNVFYLKENKERKLWDGAIQTFLTYCLSPRFSNWASRRFGASFQFFKDVAQI